MKVLSKGWVYGLSIRARGDIPCVVVKAQKLRHRSRSKCLSSLSLMAKSSYELDLIR